MEQHEQQFIDLSFMELKSDHEKRPIWVTSDNKIFLETFNKLYRQAYEFIISIAMPISRPSFIQEYELTQYSLYSAMVLQLTPQKIIQFLTSLAKNLVLPPEVTTFIVKNTQNYGSTKLFLKEHSYYLEIFDEKVLQLAIGYNPKIQDLLVEVEVNQAQQTLQIKENPEIEHQIRKFNQMLKKNDQNQEMIVDMERMLQPQSDQTQQAKQSRIFRIKQDHYQITKTFIYQNIPIIEEYDINQNNTQDESTSLMVNELQIELLPTTKIRQYQEKALSKVFIENKGRSGVIVLPCGAGKTLVGIVAVCMSKRNTIVFCNSTMVIPQWKNQLKKFTNIEEDQIICMSSKYFDDKKWQKALRTKGGKGFIVLTTYAMVSKKREEGVGTKKSETLEQMKNVQWGLCLLDEVQVVPANTFQKVLLHMKAHFKLGLTATLVREDHKIVDLNYMIGPKLFEENWLDLINNGFLSRPYCIEVRVNMPPPFLHFYQTQGLSSEAKIMTHSANPNKFLALQYLIKRHENRGDQIIVFGDKPFILKEYARRLRVPVGTGQVSSDERTTILNYFMKKKIQTIILSSIGDTAIDLPDANVVIQISSFFRSRKQEAQRLGRILRPKEHDNSRFNAFFYSLVSLETDETIYASKRQRFLIDQGFSFEILTKLPYMDDQQQLSKMQMADLDSQLKWLANIQQHLDRNTTTTAISNQNISNNNNNNQPNKQTNHDSSFQDGDTSSEDDQLFPNQDPLNTNNIYMEYN